LRLISLLFLVVVKISVFNSLLVTYVPLIFSNLILLFYILKKKGINFSLFKVVSFKDILNQYKSGYEFFINSIVVSLGTTVWPIIFGKYVPYSQIAAFGVMDKFTRGIVNFIAPLPNFLLSKSNPLQTLYSFVKRYSFLFSIVVCFLLLIPFVFMLIPDGIFSFLFGKDFLQNRGIMNFYSFHFIIGFINYFSFIIIVHVKKERVYTISFVISYIIWVCIGFYSNSFIYLPLLIDLSFISFTLFYLIYYKHVSFNNNSNL
jgi:O-antigen/teichoic acid export membrane protein